MNTSNDRDASSTDLMHRRVRLAECGRFSWSGALVALSTNSASVLRAAEHAGFTKQESVDDQAYRWEITAESSVDDAAGDCTCQVFRDARSIYVSVGHTQWFAFDRATGDGAGFVTIGKHPTHTDANLTLYFRALVDALGTLVDSGQREGLMT
ncbi:hypothetical protein HNQ77_004586 [Silvibacterium bohemicum]|uniref:Uncharacterized protein n=1 Tax=Silvibacterium bohemicum TaxID=1577686 RepID=A0A841K1Y5_9BACT|nr:hypothetical protein [Silvibacterium bohemicum]MBB6146607.1 hypothetical protein [Silvibacterium bohemicum]